MGKKAHVGPSGLLVVDKPAGITSHDVVSRVRRLAQTRKVGHAGTLDPMATGILILGVGKATKLLTYLVGESKTYQATIRLGVSTVTDDAEGEVTAVADSALVGALTPAMIGAEVERLTGNIMQVPSAVSAIKVKGVRSYARVRGGEEVQLDARPIVVSEFIVHSAKPAVLVRDEFSDWGDPVSSAGDTLTVLDLDVTVSCSSGTYIRALARDLGAALGVGAHLTYLRRSRVGAVDLEQAFSLEELAAQAEAEQPLPLLSLEDAAAGLFEVRQLSAAEATDISNGRRISPSETKGITAAFAPDASLLALIEDTSWRGSACAAPVLVFEAGRTFEEGQ